MPNDYRKSFHDDLNELKAGVLHLAAMATETVAQATEVLLTGDMEGAARLIEGDDALDEVSVDIDERCFRLLARQAPVAGDLRAIVATMRINSDLERSGDLMVNVAKAARRMYGVEIPPRLRGLLQDMSYEAGRLLRLAGDAYSENSGALGDALHDVDDRLDALQREMVLAVFESHAKGEIDVSVAVQLAVISRYYERVGDHAVNMGERVLFMAEGSLPEHNGAARARARREARVAGATDAAGIDAAAGADGATAADVGAKTG